MAHLAVLTARPELPIYAELERAGGAAGHRVELVDALRVTVRAAPPGAWLGGEELDLAALDAVLPRVGNWRPESTLAAVETFAAAGVRPLNSAAAIRRGRDHWSTAASLAAVGVPHPRTVTAADPETLAAVAADLLGFPCVVKRRSSRQGMGVVLCESRDKLDGVVEAFWRLGDEVVVQQFCPPGGVSRRVLVLDGEVLGAAEHRAGAGEFRSNAARGGSVVAVALESPLADLALAAASVMELAFCGIDLFLDRDRWVVGEVNPTPGWKHFAAATGVDVAARLVAALARCGCGA